jgi:hypothetical protein
VDTVPVQATNIFIRAAVWLRTFHLSLTYFDPAKTKSVKSRQLSITPDRKEKRSSWGQCGIRIGIRPASLFGLLLALCRERQ